MRVKSINGKRYVLVIADDYSHYTGVIFLRSKDEAPEDIKTFLKKITVLLQALVIIVRTYYITEFKNQVLKEYFDSVAISHQSSFVRTPQQNGVRLLQRATLKIAPTFIVDLTKTNEIINGRKPYIFFLHVFRALCYPKNDHKDIGKLGAKALRTAPAALANQNLLTLNASTTVEESTPTPTNSSSYAAESSSSQYVDPSNMHTFYQPYQHDYQWTKDHPLEQVIGEPLQPVLIGNQLRIDEELLQFKRLDVWVFVSPPDNIKPLTLKWLFKNNLDEENTVIRNKTRLVVRGYRQEKGIDFKESFPLVAKMEVIRIFLAYAKHKLFIIFQIGEMTFFLGLQVNQSPRGIFINQSNYGLEILEKYVTETCDHISTPMDIKEKLDVDKNGTLVDATKYRSMIGSLMYLTSSRPDIVHATCLCARYQAQPTEKNLKAVKRIFFISMKPSIRVKEKSCQNQRDLPRDSPLDRVEVLRHSWADAASKSLILLLVVTPARVDGVMMIEEGLMILAELTSLEELMSLEISLLFLAELGSSGSF
nr:hypothetical protein [Tanacetum cinerariifolium]